MNNILGSTSTRDSAVPYKNVREVLATLTQWVKVGKGFLHVRFNDGECNAMFGLRKETETNCDGHYYYEDMGKALLQAFMTVKEMCKEGGRRDSILLGSYLAVDPGHEGAERLIHWLDANVNAWHALPWATGDVWCHPEYVLDSGELRSLIWTIRETSYDRPVVLVSSPEVRLAKYCLGASVVEVPPRNAWKKREEVKVEVTPYARDGGIIVWCCGFLSRALSSELYYHYPMSSHLDLGHIFDGVFGIDSRQWLANKGNPDDAPGVGLKRWEYYQEVFAPFVRSFIP